MRTRTGVLLAAAVPVTVAAAAAVLKAGHWQLYADRHRIHLTPVARRSCPDCRGAGGWWVGPGAAINASTHAAIDRGALLLWLAKKTNKTGYIEHCQAARVDDDGKATSELTGPGSAWMELDVLCTNAVAGGAR